MFIADTHSDTLFNIGVMHQAMDSLMINPEKLRRGGVSLQTFAMWSGRYGNKGDYEAIAAAELAAAPLMEAAGIRKVDNPADAASAKEGEACFMLSLEGCEVFEKGLQAVAQYREYGVRMGALVWNNPNALGFPAKGGSKEGLTAYGIQVVKEMQRLGMAVDTSHLNEAGFYDIFAKTDKAPLASHSCCTSLCNHFRNLTDAQLKLMIREGGYVGINFYPYFLREDGKATLQHVVEHIDHVCQLGGDGIVGFGSDFDGIECCPEGLAGADDMPKLIAALQARGYSQTAIEGIAGKNLLAYYERIA